MAFRKDFVWGAAASAYQIEGAAFEDGKGESIWDVFSHQPGKVFDGHTGDTACGHYHCMEKDVEMMADLGLKAYRFSVSWPRVLPQGIGDVNEAGMHFYERLVDMLLEHGITPYVTLYHWDMPYALYLRGGWMNPESPQWFAEYAALIGRRLKGKVKHFITFNEPQVFIGCSFIQTVHAPGVRMERRECLQMSHNVLLAHGRAVQALRAEVPGVQIGYAPTSNAAVPVSESLQDQEAARQAYFATPGGDDWVWSVAWWSDPVLLGKYPEDGMKILEKDMPHVGGDDMKLISQPIDFYGQNIYRGDPVRMGQDGRPEFLKHPAGGPKTAIGWHVNFDCLYWAVKFLNERYKKPIYITENGMSCHDWLSLDGKVHDSARIDYLHRHLLGLRRAAEEGIDIAGYFQWSLMDNFEWSQGYSDRFGLVYIDFATLERIPKDSYEWYRETIHMNGENL
ncbi:GH1 family beta-glucosidase [Murimonas intestini]|uniref:Beta-glucosidase n=1 Tax=Murimonas intestini TaxID=1337051 RepID=A0AB73T086_9FIRM|nr:GH1 family beta-glucosidase [Murimonas intestini]MCR1842298.1 GH1 family beta-glucosidase [Murimonas intestini]MCR1867779.1 GH1 family beta-glucosidase [Murimonas intestini]MCR1886231.1 GH1 family beta-glucosidase [Murimonas intestini]